MNNTRHEFEDVRPTYMSQVEAKEVMNLWAERQQEEASRQAMVTIHDVAEATQLSAQDVERLLQEVRTRNPVKTEPNQEYRAAAIQPSSGQPTLMEAYVRLAPMSGLLVFVYWVFTHVLPTDPILRYLSVIQRVIHGLSSPWLFYAIAVGIWYVAQRSKGGVDSPRAGSRR
ncbi:MAG: hypothetical protein P4L46_19320 [Fimbriimonas sp.]|nr:hypothetical protein [Fimbriimonas sp.]